jgi:hypothetical protein
MVSNDYRSRSSKNAHWAAAVIGWNTPSPADAAWVQSATHDLFDGHVMLPAISEVVLVEETLAYRESEISR